MDQVHPTRMELMKVRSQIALAEQGRAPFEATPDTVEWAEHVLTDESWEQWRQEEPEQVARMRRALAR